MFNSENSGPSTTVEVETTVQQVNEGETPKVLCIVTECTQIFLRLSKTGDRSTASQLVEVLHDPTLDLDILKKIFKNLKYCKEVSFKSTKEIIKHDRFQRAVVRCGRRKNEGHGF